MCINSETKINSILFFFRITGLELEDFIFISCTTLWSQCDDFFFLTVKKRLVFLENDADFFVVFILHVF